MIRAAVLMAALVAGSLVPGRCQAEVTLTPVPPSPRWPGAAEEGALGLACGSSTEELRQFFGREGLPLRPDLVRDGTEPCHVLYRPTLPGFRASPDDEPLKGIRYDADALLFLATARLNRGDAVGAMTEVLRRIERPLDVGVVLHGVHEDAAYEKATARAFGDTPHRVRLMERGVDRNFWWVQDYLKAGTVVERGPTLLIPRRLFEGGPENASVFDPLLERLSEDERVVRSKLSWEGGDLQLTRDPEDPERLVLYYGTFVKPYWGESLTDEEFAYVLSLEFGADHAVDLGGLAPHVDYVVAFLPRARTALVSVPRSGDLDLARAVVESLLASLADDPHVLLALRELLASPSPSPAEIARLLDQARQEQGAWGFVMDEGLLARTQDLVARVCPDREDCFTPEDQVRLAEADPALFEEWIHSVQHARDEPVIISAHLDLLESQIEVVPADVEERTQEKIAELESLGFQVIPVPAYRVNLKEERDWPGISYVNALVVDDQVFIPRFGLGEAEEGIFRLVQARMPSGYSIVPIDARRVLIRNGGLHCLAGLVR